MGEPERLTMEHEHQGNPGEKPTHLQSLFPWHSLKSERLSWQCQDRLGLSAEAGVIVERAPHKGLPQTGPGVSLVTFHPTP